MPSQNTSSGVDVYAENLRRGLPTGAEYAAAIGLIGSIVRPSRFGVNAQLTDAERLQRIGWTLDALDRVLDEAADIEDAPPRGTDAAEHREPPPAGVDGYAPTGREVQS